MVRMRGGSPKNMRQGQYWVRRHLDDQRRASRAAATDAAAADRRAKAAVREDVAHEREQARYERQRATVQRQLNLSRHFSKVQGEVQRALASAGSTQKGDDFSLKLDCDEELQHILTEAVAAYQAHADHLNNNGTTSATALSKHIANSKRMLAGLGRAKGIKTRWLAAERRFTFGDLELDFGEPEPMSVEEWGLQQGVSLPSPARRTSVSVPPAPPQMAYQPVSELPRYKAGSSGGLLVAACLVVIILLVIVLVS